MSNYNLSNGWSGTPKNLTFTALTTLNYLNGCYQSSNLNKSLIKDFVGDYFNVNIIGMGV